MSDELNIPESWVETKISDICVKTIQAVPDRDFQYIDINSVNNTLHIVDDHKELSSKDAPSRARKTVQENDIVYSTVRPYLKNIAMVPDLPNPIASTGFSILRPLKVNSAFLFNYVRSDMFLEMIKPLQKGASYPAVTDSEVNSMTVPLPPFKEQERIVEKIESCFSKIEKAETTLREAEALLSKYRESLLTKAFRGELIPQDSKDEPVGELLKRIKEKQTKNDNGKKKKNELPPIGEDEIPFDIPESWKWVRLGNVLSKITDGTHHSPDNTATGEYKYITAKNIKDWGISLKKITYVSEDIHKDIYSRCDPLLGDVFLIKDGATTGISCINTLDEEFSMLSSVALLRTDKRTMLNIFLLNYLKSPVFQELVFSGMAGAAIKRITLEKIGDMVIPLPPINEQVKIANLIDSQLSTALKAKNLIKKKLSLTSKLKESILNNAFQGKLVPQIPEEGTGHELLAQILKAKELETPKKKVAKKASDMKSSNVVKKKTVNKHK